MNRLTILAPMVMLAFAGLGTAAPITEEIIAFDTHDGLTLEGYICHPRDSVGPFPGVLLIAGSGLHDADVTVSAAHGAYGVNGTQKLYRGLARDFCRQGFAVLRYNKRGATFDHVDDNPNLLIAADHRDLLEDARNAFRTLVRHPRTDAGHLTVVGNSEGVLLALWMGVRQRNIDLLILIGSPAYGFEKSMRYQNVDRTLFFASEAGDANDDGFLTLDELDRIDGNHGRGSFHIATIQALLFDLRQQPNGSQSVNGFHPDLDVDGDGQVDIRGELEPALVVRMQRSMERWRSGELGRYYQSFFENKAPLKSVHRVHGKILFAQGELDVVTHVSETLALIEKLDRFDRPWDAILFPKLGHTLSKSRDYYRGDSGLTILDNPTQNAPQKKARLRIVRKAREMLDLGN